MTGLALTLARRNLRGGWRHFRLAVAGLALGVATIAGVANFAAGLGESLRSNGRVILGGDVALQTVMSPPTGEQIAWLEGRGALSRSVDIHAMAAADGREPLLVGLRAVDALWPLYGTARLEPPQALEAALAARPGSRGTVVGRAFLERMDLDIGGRFALGGVTLHVSAVLAGEPDRASAPLRLGPRVIVSAETLEATGLAGPGSLVRHVTRLRLARENALAGFLADLDRTFPDASWRVRSHEDANPQLRRFLDNLAKFVALVGLTALLVGGIGVASAVSAYLERQRGSIAILKSLGASVRLVFAVYLIEVAVMAGLGVALGLAAGIVAPLAAGGLLRSVLPVPPEAGLWPGPLLLAAAYGALTALAFAWPALARTRDIAPAALLRVRDGAARAMRGRDRAATAGLVLVLAALAVVSSADRTFAAIFVAGAALAFLLFRAAGHLVMRLARAWAPGRGLVARMALANLAREGAPTPAVTVAFGIGLAVLTAVAGVQANLRGELGATVSRDAPAFFFVDIQPDQLAPFRETVAAVPGVSEIRSSPSLRARMVRIAGVPVAEAAIDPDARWSVEGDLGASYAAAMPAGTELVAGAWWPEDHDGPPLVSFYEDLAAGYGIGPGETLTVSILGREITATVTSVRRIDWSDIGINFVLVFAPGLLEQAPHTHIATVHAPPEAETTLRRETARRFPNVSAIAVRDVLDDILDILGRIDAAVAGIASLALVAGIVVLAESVMAAHRQRLRDAAIMKVLGTTRGMLAAVFAVEHLALGIAVAIPALAVGTAGAWAAVTFALSVPWTVPWAAMLALAGLALAVSLAAGLLAGWFALSRSAAAVLRAE